MMGKIGETLFFQANDGTTGEELWKITAAFGYVNRSV
jgi:hypothetical protein